MQALGQLRSSNLVLTVVLIVTGGGSCLATTQKALQSIFLFPGSTSIGHTSPPLLVSVQIIADGASSAFVGVVKGSVTGDYVIGAGGTCQKQVTYTSGQQCTLSVSFQPQRPGLRQGALLILAADGTLLGSTLVSGLGIGSLQEIGPGNIITVAGNGASVYSDSVNATQTSFARPLGVVVDPNGNLYISDTGNNRIRRVDAVTREVSTIAGVGESGLLGEGGPAVRAQLSSPSAIALDGVGNIFFADTGNNVIRRVDKFSGVISSVVGTLGAAGYSGDGGAATSASLSSPSSFVLDNTGGMVIADTGNNVVRRVDAQSGLITTIAGTGIPGFNGDGILANKSQLNSPQGVGVSVEGLVYVADTKNNRVRMISADGTMATVAGDGVKGNSPTVGGGALAILNELNGPTAIVFDPAGRYFFSDTGNSVVREIDVVPNIARIAGTANSGFSGDGGIASYASLSSPVGLSYSDEGNIYVADASNNRIRELLNQQVTVSYPEDTVGVTIGSAYLLIENHGNASLTLQTPFLDNAQLGSDTTCVVGYVITPAHGCAVFLKFDPAAVGSPVVGSISWPSDSVDSPSIFTLSGKVIPTQPFVSLTSSLNPSVFSTAVTFTASVVSTSPKLGGLIDFLDGAVELCRATLDGGGSATCSVASLTPGRHTINASYLGDANDYAAVSPPLTQTVKQTVLLSLNASPDPAIASHLITLISQVTGLSTSRVPIGSVTFFAETTSLGNASIDHNGSATLAVSLPAGSYSLVASFAATEDFADANSAPVIEVVNAQTMTALTCSPDPGFQNGNETLTATISPFAIAGPGGTITFLDGGTTIGAARVDGIGRAVFFTPTLSVGTHALSAIYSGTTNLLPSTSPQVSLIIVARDFSLATDPDINIQTEHHKNLSLTLTSLGNLSDRIALSCGDLPLYATCSFNGDTSLEAGSVLSGSIDIDTDAVLNFVSNRPTPPLGGTRLYSRIILALLLPPLLFTAKRRRLLLTRVFLGLIVFFLADALTACSGRFPGHTPPGTYTITVTGKGIRTGLTHTANVVLVVTE